MDLHIWWVYTVTIFLLICTPGPNMLFVMSNSARFGAVKSIPAMVGCWVAVVSVLIASAAGLSAIFITFPNLFNALRYIGAVYLFYLGVKIWLEKERIGEKTKNEKGITIPSRLILFRNGLAIGFSNPKLFIFASAFFPQFVTQEGNKFFQFFILICTFAIVELFWYLVYSIGGQKLTILFKRTYMMKIFNRITGLIFIAFGIALLFSSSVPKVNK